MKKGFTLVETLICLVLFGMFILSIAKLKSFIYKMQENLFNDEECIAEEMVFNKAFKDNLDYKHISIYHDLTNNLYYLSDEAFFNILLEENDYIVFNNTKSNYLFKDYRLYRNYIIINYYDNGKVKHLILRGETYEAVFN